MPTNALIPASFAADEIDNPIEDPVIGDGDRRQAIRRRGRNHILYLGRTVEHRILGVDVEVCE